MEHFTEVGLEDKLVLLMSAINKINTNFYYKIDAFKKQLSDDIHGVMPRLRAIEKDDEEQNARLDDAEGHCVPPYRMN